MKSGQQRWTEIKKRRAMRRDRKRRKKNPALPGEISTRIAPCNPALLATKRSYGIPSFMERGYYCDIVFL
jgi:hypothetical protein